MGWTIDPPPPSLEAILASVRRAADALQALMLQDAWDGLPPARQEAIVTIAEAIEIDLCRLRDEARRLGISTEQRGPFANGDVPVLDP